jgi:ABC-type phosphate transport system substrate-binding protein
MRPIQVIACLAFAVAGLGAQTVVIVSSKNPISKLTKEQTAQIFLGQSHTFITGGTAEPLDMAEGSELRKDFYQKALNKPPAQMKAYWSKLEFSGTGRAPKALASSEEMVKLVGENPKYVGYVDAASVNPSVKIVLTL